jgi:methionyl-tRNA synthetase
MMMKDGKMSKSKGNVIPVPPLVNVSAWMRSGIIFVAKSSLAKMANSRPEQFVERLNSDLANNLGNLLNRTVSMIKKYYEGVDPRL